jgi:hypothetical protein
MYPTLTISAADSVAACLVSALELGERFEIWNQRDFQNLHSDYVKDRNLPGTEVDIDGLFFGANQIAREISEFGFENKFEYEELYAEMLHKELSKLPSAALQDPGFWRYLALFPYRGYLKQREPDFKPIRYGGGTGSLKSQWLLPRTFIWGRKTAGSSLNDYKRTHILRELRKEAGKSSGTVIDFYHSHIVRPGWTSNSSVAEAFVDAVMSEPLLFDEDATANRPSNRMSSSVARLSNNVLLEFALEDGIPATILKTKNQLIENKLSMKDVLTGIDD